MAEGVTSLGRLNVTAASPAAAGDAPSEARRAVEMAVTVAIFAVGVPLNGLVVWVLGVRGGRLRAGGGGGGGGEETRGAGTFRQYVVHLALADLVLVLRVPLMLGYLAAGYSWPFGAAACRLVMFLRGLGLYANAFLLCAISAERCLCLLHPVWFRLRRPRWTVPLACALLWLLAAALAAPYLATSSVVAVANRSQCWDTLGGDAGLLIAETTLGFVLPLLIFVGSNLAVLVTAGQAGGGGGTPKTATASGAAAAPVSKRLARLYRVLSLTMLLFLTCWVPYFPFRFLLRLSYSAPEWAWLRGPALTGVYVALYLVYAKSALNPVLYVFAARGLSRAVRASVFSAVGRIFNEDTSDYARRRSLRRNDSQI